MKRSVNIWIIVLSLFYSSTVAEADYFDSTFPEITLSTIATCQGYNPQENIASVSPYLPLRLFVQGQITTPVQFYLLDSSLGQVSTYPSGILEISFLTAGSTTLVGTTTWHGQSVVVTALPIVFVPARTVTLDLYHVYDPKGYSAWNLNQEQMIQVLQKAEGIVNQAGVSIELGMQSDLYLPTSVGSVINASASSLSPEESVIINQVQLNSDHISVFVVWDYQIDKQSKAGISFALPNSGTVMFMSDRGTKPAETLAHEIMHSIGLSHTEQGENYLMYPQEKSDIEQCLFTQSELALLAQAW